MAWSHTAFHLWLLLCVASVGGVPLWNMNGPDDLVAFNGTSDDDTLRLESRGISKRELFLSCEGGSPGMSDLVARTLQDVYLIVDNMLAHLNLINNMYDPSGSGELLESKQTKAQRTFDEHNAFASYQQMVSKIHYQPGDARNRQGYGYFLQTRAMAQTLRQQIYNYINGISTTWTRSSAFPYITLYCTDEELYSATNTRGLSWQQDNGYNPQVQNWTQLGGQSRAYFLAQTKGTMLSGFNLDQHQSVWTKRVQICMLEDGANTRYWIVPTARSLKAYVEDALFGLVEESLVLCPLPQPAWLNAEAVGNQNGVHYRNLHVGIGGTPSEAQSNAAAALIGQHTTLGWFNQWLATTLIHEFTHATAMVGKGNDLLDINCFDSGIQGIGEQTQTPMDPGCQFRIAQGIDGRMNGPIPQPQGYKSPELFAKYAMAVYVNAVTWFKTYQPVARA